MSTLQCGLVSGAYWLEGAATDPPERRNQSMGFSGRGLLLCEYQDIPPEVRFPHLREHPIPKVFPHYAPDRSRPCKTGERVPWTGVWYPDGDIEKDDLYLTFAIEGRPMTPAWRLVKTDEEVEEELLKEPGYTRKVSGDIFDEKGEIIPMVWPQYEIMPITWYPFLEVPTVKEEHLFADRVEDGQPCPKGNAD